MIRIEIIFPPFQASEGDLYLKTKILPNRHSLNGIKIVCLQVSITIIVCNTYDVMTH